jgi:hypothetical protein
MTKDNKAAVNGLQDALDEMQRNRGDEAAWKRSYKKVEAADRKVDWAQWRRDHEGRR